MAFVLGLALGIPLGAVGLAIYCCLLMSGRADREGEA